MKKVKKGKRNQRFFIALVAILAIIVVSAVLLTAQQKAPSEQYCSPESRKGEACTAIYQHVCGWFDPQKIQCIRYPCASTYSNSCFACMDEKVLYWTEGECPK